MPKVLAVLLGASVLLNVLCASRLLAPAREGTPVGRGRPPRVEPSPGEENPPAAADERAAGEELSGLRERVARLAAELESERLRTRAPVAAPVAPGPAIDPQTEKKLARTIDARFGDRGLLEVLEILRQDCDLMFIYDPAAAPRLEKIRVSLSMENAPARAVLDFIGEAAGVEVEYLNQWVWIKLADPKGAEK